MDDRQEAGPERPNRLEGSDQALSQGDLDDSAVPPPDNPPRVGSGRVSSRSRTGAIKLAVDVLRAVLGLSLRRRRYVWLRRVVDKHTQGTGSLSALPELNTPSVRMAAARFEVRFHGYLYWERAIELHGIKVVGVTALVLSAAASLIVASTFEHSSGEYFGIGITGFVLGFALLVPVMIVFSHTPAVLSFAILVADIILCALGVQMLINRPALGDDAAVAAINASTLSGHLVFVLAIVVGAISIVSAQMLLQRRGRKRAPDAYLWHQLRELLAREPGVDNTVRGRRFWLDGLENAASCAERDLCHSLHAGDPATDVWFRSHMEGLAAALRERKKWVLVPREDTAVALKGFIHDTALALVRGDWNALDTQAVEGVEQRRGRLGQATDLVRTLIAAMLPLTLLLVVQSSSVALKQPVADYATAGAFLWAVFTVLGALDPRFHTNIQSLKSFADAVRSPFTR